MTLLILTQSPYGTDVVYNGLRLASALAEKTDLRIFLMCDAVGAAVAGQAGGSDDANLGRRLEALAEGGVAIAVCGRCLEVRGLHNARMIEGIHVGSMPELAEWVLEAATTLSL